MTALPGGGDVGVGVLEGRGDQRSELPLMKRSPSAARSLATDAPKRTAGSQRALDIGGQPARRTPSAESQRRRKEGGGTGPDGPQATTTGRKEATSSSDTWLRHVASDGNISHVVQVRHSCVYVIGNLASLEVWWCGVLASPVLVAVELLLCCAVGLTNNSRYFHDHCNMREWAWQIKLKLKQTQKNFPAAWFWAKTALLLVLVAYVL